MIDAFPEIDQTEVTVRDWKACEAAGACPAVVVESEKTPPQCNAPLVDRLDHPMNCVTWEDAKAFCGWAGGRLPSEEEWEYAAAAGAEGRVNPFPWGAAPNAQNANGAGDGDGYVFTAPVGKFPRGASDFNVLDMAGNVEEWTASPFAQVLSMPGVSSPDDADRVTRGGSYESDARALRASSRSRAYPSLRAPTLGFRCVRAR